jgi:hypothetical protein
VTGVQRKYTNQLVAISEDMDDQEEIPDLSGDVEILSTRPVFVGPYSIVYRGKLKSNGELVRIQQVSESAHSKVLLGGHQGFERNSRCSPPHHAKGEDS